MAILNYPSSWPTAFSSRNFDDFSSRDEKKFTEANNLIIGSWWSLRVHAINTLGVHGLLFFEGVFDSVKYSVWDLQSSPKLVGMITDTSFLGPPS